MADAPRDIILVPTDFSEVADFAVDHAIEIARIFNHKIFLLHVMQKKNFASPLKDKMLEKIEKTAARIIQKTSLEVNSLIEEGSIFQTISQVADRIRAEFIVMGIHGKKGVQHIIGSYAYKVVTSVNVPVLLVKHLHHHTGYHNIVIPVDFSRENSQKLQQAVRFARYFDATIRVFGFLPSKSPALVFEKEALIKKVKDFFDNNKVKVTTNLLIKPGTEWPQALVDFSEEIDADLVMIVAEKGGSLMDVFTQNIPEKIIDKIDTPVLTVCQNCYSDEDEKNDDSFFTTFIDPMDVIKKRKNSED